MTFLEWIAIVTLFYLYFKLNKKLAALSTLARADSPDDPIARKLQELFKPTPPASPTPFFDFSGYLSNIYTDLQLLDFCVFILLFIVVIYVAKRTILLYTRRNTFRIFLDIQTDTGRLLIPVKELPHGPYMYQFKATEFINRIIVSGYLWPQLHIEWSSLTMRHKLLQTEFQLTPCHINIVTAHRLRQLLHRQPQILLFTKMAS